MNCCSSQSKGHGCCHSGAPQFGPHFWTKEKKIQMLEQHLENLNEKIAETKDMIAGLKAEK